MEKTKLCELQIILNDLENTMKEMQEKREWLTVAEVAEMLRMCISCVSTFKERPAFKKFTKNTTYGCMIKNCPEAIQLMRCYKYRNFDYEKELLFNKVQD